MKRLAALLIALVSPPTLAQGPVPLNAAGRALNAEGTLKVDYTEVRAGPGAAYISRGRAYQGDRLQVLRRDPSGDWFEVTVSGVRGWVRTRTVQLKARGDARAAGGRDRRQTNYQYDAQGRRQFADGRSMGTGEGTAGAPPPVVFEPTSTPAQWRLRYGVGVAQLTRQFESAIEDDSALRKLSVSPLAVTQELALTYEAHRNVQARLLLRDARLSAADIPANAAFGFPQALTIDVNAQQVELDATGRMPFAGGWAGLYAGAHVFRQAFQETRPYALFLSNTFIGLHTGAAAEITLGPVALYARGGVVLPLSISQSPADSGAGSALGALAALEAAWPLNGQWALTAQGHFFALQTDFEGPSTHADPYTGTPPRTYARAREDDALIGGGLGIRWQP
jgi:hypothetical protein